MERLPALPVVLLVACSNSSGTSSQSGAADRRIERRFGRTRNELSLGL